MILTKIVCCIVLMWFHLSNSVLHDKTQLENQYRVKRNRIFVNHNDKDTGNIVESTNENSTNYLDTIIIHFYFSRKNEFLHEKSAKFNFSQLIQNRVENESTHKLASSTVKRTSALRLINNNDKKTRKSEKKVFLSQIEKRVTLRKLLENNNNNDNNGNHLSEGLRKDDAEAELFNGRSTISSMWSEASEDLTSTTGVNITEFGSYLGAPCEQYCSKKLLHVYCDPRKRICQCEDKYPVQIGIGAGCEKPKQLGDQCFYAQTCSFFDPNADCTQINHNAICQCKPGYHTVALRKGVKRVFCSEDIVVVSADLPTLLGVATGIAVLTGLLCFVLRLFSSSRYPAARHYGNANLTPPLLLSGDNQWVNGIPLTVQGRSSSRASYQRSTTSLALYPRTKGVHVPSSRAGAARAAAILLIPCHLPELRQPGSGIRTHGKTEDAQENEVERSYRSGSRRPSLTSIHSTTSSQKSISYSARRFEQENQQREQRALKKAVRGEVARTTGLPSPNSLSIEDVVLISASTNNEEDFLCSGVTDSSAQSEPPALLIRKGNTDMSPSISGTN